MTRPFIQSRAPRLFSGKYSQVLPQGFSFVVDRDGVTFLTDSEGRLLMVRNDG